MCFFQKWASIGRLDTLLAKTLGPGLFKAQGHYRFRVTGMIKVFWGGIEIFDSGILGGRKILFGKYLFGWLDFIRGLLCTQNSGPCGTPLTSAFKRKMLFDFF